MQSVWFCSKMHGTKPRVRDGRGAQRSRVRSTRDGTPGQPARAVYICVLLHTRIVPCSRYALFCAKSPSVDFLQTPLLAPATLYLAPRIRSAKAELRGRISSVFKIALQFWRYILYLATHGTLGWWRSPQS